MSRDPTDAEPAGAPAGSPDDVLRVRNLTTRFFTEEGQVNAVEGVDFDVRDGEVFGIVGESGSGKSVTALSVIDLVESPGRITDGEVWYREPDLAAEFEDDVPAAVDGEFVDVRRLPEGVRRSLRGPSFSMIFQDPMSSLNPSVTVGEQIAEAVEVQRRASANPRRTRSRTQGYGLGRLLVDTLVPGRGYTSEASEARAVELLEQVGIPDPAERADEYPHQFSGGMLQRAMVAQALAGEPDVLIADEPTTALDVTIQAQILNLLRDLQAEQDTSVVMITHDLGVIARMCQRVGVMYAGQVVERGTLADVFDDPVHPYTEGLLGSIPDMDEPASRLEPIEGNVPSLLDSEMGERCYFADRCPKAMEDCLRPIPMYDAEGSDEHETRCVLAVEEYDEAAALPDGYFESEPDSASESGSADDPAAGEEVSTGD
ncbi:ABC transporter ATP-binding protein [Candidatus Halobonum tyrrellensis]|uniref:Nickel import system ATP-binding protein NikD n=1 Tax=Candidatus Halobonum tyrrellensis G22 TaxID=1324957 RepID=V4IXB0_9EURY|nr:ABC transporter ATP-binding protein [Candidatus Halobonum tyrrellensis]ESP87792.1 oligopeptide/dipeptide ABC transporter ATPase [Candidatus Halobonum tyrrellensis G22]